MATSAGGAAAGGEDGPHRLPRLVQQPEAVAAQSGHVRIDRGQGGGHGDAGLDGVAALGQHRGGGLGRLGMGCHGQAAAAFVVKSHGYARTRIVRGSLPADRVGQPGGDGREQDHQQQADPVPVLQHEGGQQGIGRRPDERSHAADRSGEGRAQHERRAEGRAVGL